jgi:hypothetical protein
MNTETLISNLVGALAWPIGVVAVVAMLRPALLDLLGHLRSVRFRGIEAVFGEELARARDIVERADLAGVPLDEGLSDEQSEKLLRLAKISPRSAVIEAWGLLEAEARAIIETHRPRQTTVPLTAATIGDSLAELGILDSESSQAYFILRTLRNQAIHEPHLEITTDEAVEYANLSRGLAHRLLGADNG